jgi:hypothetical protein
MRESKKTSLQSQKRDQQWIDEALANGPETPLTKKEMQAVRDRVLRGKKRPPSNARA